MAHVRLFARLRELAGTSRVDIAGDTVGEVLSAAQDKFGSEFAQIVETSRVWRNGEETGPSDSIDPGDELAVLPPVSGGAMTATIPPEVMGAGSIVLGLVLVLVNLRADSAWWAAALVGAAGLWIIDVATQMNLRGRAFPAIAAAIGAVGGALLASSMGAGGLAIAIAVAVMVVLGWGVGVAGQRSVDSLAPGVLVAMLAAAAVGSLVLSRSEVTPDPEAVDVFLIAVIVATLFGSLVDRLEQLPYVDPFTVTALVAILAAVGTAYFRELDVAGYLLVGLGLAVTLVAGRGFGALLRTGSPALAERVPGILRGLDGALLAAALYFPWIRLVL